MDTKELNPFASPSDVTGGAMETKELNPFASPSDVTSGVSESQEDAESIRRRYLRHEAAIQEVGSVAMLSATATLCALVFIVVPTLSEASSNPRTVPGDPLAIATTLVALVWTLWTGFQLRMLKPRGRGSGIALATFGLLGVPFGTMFSVYILYLLLSKKGIYVLSEPYAAIRQATPHIKYNTKRILWLALFLFVALVIWSLATSWT